MAAYEASFETVPGDDSLVRLQLQITGGQDGAKKLCKATL